MFKLIMQALTVFEAVILAIKAIWKKKDMEELNEEVTKKDDSITNDNLRDLLQ